MANRYINLLSRNRNYRLLMSAEAVSIAGDWFNVIAVVTLLGHSENASALAVAWVLVLKQLPMLFISPVAGVVADRFNRKVILILSDLFRAAIIAALIFVPDLAGLWLIYPLLLLCTVFTGFFQPAANALLPDIVESSDLLTANAMGSILWSSMMVISTGIGGLVTELVGWRLALGLDAMTFVISAVLISLISLGDSASAERTVDNKLKPENTLHGLRIFVGYMRENRKIFLISIAKGVIGLGGAMYLLQILYGQQLYAVGNTGAFSVSLILMARGFGAMSGPIISRWLFGEGENLLSRNMFIGYILCGGSYILAGLIPSFAAALFFVYLAHFGSSLVWVFSSALRQMSVNSEIQGRTAAFDYGLFTLTNAISCLVAGALIDLNVLDILSASVVAGVVIIICGSLWYRVWTQKG